MADFKGIVDLSLLSGVGFGWYPFILADLVQIGLALGFDDESVEPRSTLKSMSTCEIDIPELFENETLKELQKAGISDPEQAMEIAKYHHNRWYLSKPTDLRFEFGTLQQPGYYPMYAIMAFFRVPYEQGEQSLVYWENDLESIESSKLYHDIFQCKLIFNVSSPKMQTAIGEMFARRHYLSRD